MDIRREELVKLSVILREFEYLIQSGNSTIGDSEKGNLVLFSANIRFKIIDALNIQDCK
jgi:hypothetical protein